VRNTHGRVLPTIGSSEKTIAGLSVQEKHRCLLSVLSLLAHVGIERAAKKT
jgi:hypothetical protein